MTELSFFDKINASNKLMRRLILVLAMAALTFSAVSQPKVKVQAQADPAVSGDRESTSKTGAIIWTEQILNRDKTINWTKYENVAAHAGELTERDYLLGPKYAYYHPKPEQFPTLALQGDADGWEGPPNYKKYLKTGGGAPGETDWYAQAGSLLYVADDSHNAGVMSAGNGESFIYGAGTTPSYGFWCKVNWQSRRCCYLYPDPPELQQPDWNSPRKPVAVATPTGTQAIAQYVAFQNGFIGTFAVDKCAYTHKWGCDAIGNYALTGNIFPGVQLPAGKVPMALAVTPCGEFVLAAVWDVINHKGQMAVIAVQGRVRCSETRNRDWNSTFETGTYLYGFPTWPNTKALKLLGFVDLPIAAPMAIKDGTSMGWQNNGRDDNNVNANLAVLLNNQSERDIWHNSDPTVYPNYKATAHAGYAIITSRSENKVVFIDLRPLLEYYRTMYFTTQSLYNETKNLGPAADQWPYTFDYRPEQKPVVACTLDVPAPTAVAAGLSIGHCTGCSACNASRNSSREWRVTPFGDRYAYVTTMDGKLLMYTVGGLNTEAAATPPVLYKTVDIGKNPTSIENGNGGVYKNDIFINCRGDKSIYALQPSGDLSYVLRDSRINDPVMVENSYNGRQGVNRYFIHVVDFASKKVLTYVYKQDFPQPMTFGAASEVIPGHPFAYQQDEVP
jgi:hypothetical protein